MKQRFISMLLAVLLLITALPLSAAADEPDYPVFKGTLSISEKGIDMIKDLENYIDRPTPDNTQHSIGYGCSTEFAEKYGFSTEYLTKAEAHELMLFVLDEIEETLDRYLNQYRISVNQYQYDALMSLTYNLGNAWMGSGSRITQLLAGNNYTVNELASAFVIYCHVGTGKNARVENHLVSRRIREAKLFLYGAYDFEEADEKFCRLTYTSNRPGKATDIGIYQVGQPYQILFEPDYEEATGRFFRGWFTDYGEQITPDTIVRDNMPVHAEWTDDESLAASSLIGARYPYAPLDNPPVTPRDYSDGAMHPNPEEGQQQQQEQKPEEKPPVYVEASTVFSDLRAEQWHYVYVNDLYNAKIINGYEDGTFRPENEVSCGETLKMIMLAAGYEEQAPLGETMHWASGYYLKALEDGVIEETDFKETQLDVEISRATMAKIAVRALGLTESYGVPVYFDTDDIYANILYFYGITEGYEDGTFRPENTLTRAELSTIVWRIHNGT